MRNIIRSWWYTSWSTESGGGEKHAPGPLKNTADLCSANIVTSLKNGDKANTVETIKALPSSPSLVKYLRGSYRLVCSFQQRNYSQSPSMAWDHHEAPPKMIFAARQIQEKCPEQDQELLMDFINLTKASDSVNREVSVEKQVRVWLLKQINHHCETPPQPDDWFHPVQ